MRAAGVRVNCVRVCGAVSSPQASASERQTSCWAPEGKKVFHSCGGSQTLSSATCLSERALWPHRLWHARAYSRTHSGWNKEYYLISSIALICLLCLFSHKYSKTLPHTHSSSALYAHIHARTKTCMLTNRPPYVAHWNVWTAAL